MHPDTAMLVAYRDGELGERPARKVGGHLETCGECARALAEMKAAWELLAAEAGPRPPEGPAPDGCARLQAAIEGWEKPQPDPELKRRADAHVEMYFGSGTAASLDAAAPLASIEPMLEAFLGRKAAGAVVGQILKEEDRRLCPNPGE